MKERPILFSTPMVRSILEGRKTMTRRIIKPQPRRSQIDNGSVFSKKDPFLLIVKECPYGKPGDRLWVRERHSFRPSDQGQECVKYFADGRSYLILRDDGGRGDLCGVDFRKKVHASINTRWRPSIHMPRWASRITLEIVDVRVEQLQDIDEIDAEAEGVVCDTLHERNSVLNPNRMAFELLWKEINGHDSWDANLWVWVVEFERVKA